MPEIKEYSELPGLKVYPLNIIVDERGFFAEALRRDWATFISEDEILQVNISYNHTGVIRAWHKHLRGQVDYFLVIQGAVKICAYDDREESSCKGNLVEIVTSAIKPQIVRVPGIYWHGTKNIGGSILIFLYFTNRLYDYNEPDEERRPWNDPKIIEPVTGEPYDWNKPVHR